MRPLVLAAGPLVVALAALLAPACGGGGEAPPAAPADAGAEDPATGDAGDAPDDGPAPLPPCDDGLAARPFSEGPYGILRGETAADFTVPLRDGGTFSLTAAWSGCESFLVLPDDLPRSDLDPTSIWESVADLEALVLSSPPNVHYLFAVRTGNDAKGAEVSAAMQARVEEVLAGLDATDAEHWRARLHVIDGAAYDHDAWIVPALQGHGRRGFAIDRLQRVRGVGNLADVKRYKAELEAAGHWPWEANLAYARHEARSFNLDAARQAKLDAEGDTVVVPLFSGEVLAEFAEVDVTLPTAAQMEAFDTLEIEVTQGCPDPEAIEFGNCGAWDYLAWLTVRDDATNQPIELGRFITTYHREARWLLDVSPMLAHLAPGGTRHFRWDFAPSWNPQPTATRLSLRFSNRGKGYRPVEVTPLWTGGAFGSGYNAAHPPLEVAIPADAKRVELFALVTGHGMEAANCAEFCNHVHRISVNGTVHERAHPKAGTQTGCVDEVDRGMTPNQGGTWWFGRGGWCPGQQVEPWTVDVTGDVTPGSPATLAYEALRNGAPPPDGSGTIQLSSYLVVSR